jgi:hypothetical protein
MRTWPPAELQYTGAACGRLQPHGRRTKNSTANCRGWDTKVINSAGKPASAEIRTSVIAKSEQGAREMSQERAIKENPLVTGGVISSNKIVPPYMTDPAGTLSKWQVTLGELDDEERDRVKKGILGPAAVVFYSLTPAVA